ncbi:MAG: hypothetical protein FWD83_05825 [Promicromonosporaceae bacterium]|nr:hypothetical protein [Promicromonosporaceae bacterium]
MSNSPAVESEAKAAERRVLRTAGRFVALFLIALAVLGVGIGALTVGWSGVWGALIGVALTGVFCGVTIFSMLRTIDETPVTMAAWVMGTWLAKVALLIAVLAAIRDREFFSPVALFVVVAVGALGSALLDYRAVATGHIPYTDPTNRLVE